MWSMGDQVWRLSIPWRPWGVEATAAARTSSDVSGETGGPCSRSERLPHELGTGKGRSRRSTQPLWTSPSRAGDRKRPKPEVYSSAGDVSPQAGDPEGPRRWSPRRAGPKAEGTYPVSCRLEGWSAAWVRGYCGGGARGGLNSECPGGPHLSSPTLGARC